MPRFIALDAFRGFTIAAMILVNTPGSHSHVYAPLLHATWHGWTPTDFVFPFFLFIVGSAMYFSLAAQQKSANHSHSDVVRHIIKRGLIIFAIGFAINALSLFVEPWSQVRFMGVLQRIGIVYILASLIVHFCDRRLIAPIAMCILFCYWGLLMLTGSLGLEDNIVRHIDLMLLGQSHMWEINGVAFDPEGLLSTLPSVANALVGFEITRFLVGQKDKSIALRKIVLIGAALIIVGLIWSLALPINKPLWTPSYVVFTSGIAVMLLAVFIWVVDVRKIRWLEKPCVIYGQNPLFIYVLSMIWPKILGYAISVDNGVGGSISGYEWLNLQLGAVLSPINASLMFAVLHVLLFWLIAYGLHRKNIIIKI